MPEENKIINLIKYLFGILVVISAFYIITNVIDAVELILGFIAVSVGILSIIWTLLAKYSLSPRSNLRVFTNNFLACSIAVIAFASIRIVGKLIDLPWLIVIEFFFIFATFFFFLLASYYIYSIGREFGFQSEGKKIERRLKIKKISKKRKRK
ncbi:MAG: hypothetical protein ABIB47_03165 [Candidatus Woesearchaeota archaeon]